MADYSSEKTALNCSIICYSLSVKFCHFHIPFELDQFYHKNYIPKQKQIHVLLI